MDLEERQMNSARIVIKVLLCMIVLLGRSVLGWSQDGEIPWRKLGEELVTPHFDFASRPAGAPLQILVSAFGIGQREVVELQQRFYFKPMLLPVWNPEVFSPYAKDANLKNPPYAPVMSRQDYQQELETILAQLPECQALLIGKSNWQSFPEDVQKAFLQRLSEGASLLYIGLDGQGDFPPLDWQEVNDFPFPLAAIPALQNTQIQEARHGKGRALKLEYPKNSINGSGIEPLTPFESDDPLYYDCCLAFLGKCLWYLAEPQRLQLSVDGSSGNVKLSGKIADGVVLEHEILDVFGECLRSGKEPALASQQLSFQELPATATMLLLRLRDQMGKVLDYQLAELPFHKNSFQILFQMQDGWLPNERIRGKIYLCRAFSGELLVTLTDIHGQLLYQKSTSVSKPETLLNLDISFQHHQSAMAMLSCQLRQEGKLLDEARKKIYFNTVAAEKDFSFAAWANVTQQSRAVAISLQQARQAGVDTIMEVHAQYSNLEAKYFAPRAIREADMHYATYCSRLLGPQNISRKGDCRIFSYYPDYLQKGVFPEDSYTFSGNPESGSISGLAQGARRLGVAFYNLGDENRLARNFEEENCFCQACTQRFQQYLKRVYGKLEALNAEYETEYQDWAEIQPVGVHAALEQKQVPMWVDFRLFMEEQFWHYHLLAKALIRRFDPVGKVGMEGMQNIDKSYGGFCFYKMLPDFEFCAPYFTTREANALSFMPVGSLKSAWFGTYEGTMGEEQMRQTPWRYLFHGLSGAFWWTLGNTQSSSSYSNATVFRPDLQLLEHFRQASEEIVKIKESGIGMVLRNGGRHDPGIAIHYSNNCLHASTINPDQTSWGMSHSNVLALLQAVGLSGRYLSPDELNAGVPGSVKILFLPFSQALSATETAAIQAFVQRGGLLLADHNPGIMDEHAKFHKNGSSLKEVFGEFKKMHINRYGQGHAVYLADYLAGIIGKVSQNAASGVQNGMLKIFADLAGVIPPVEVFDGQGKRQPADLFEHQGTFYLCLLGPRFRQSQARSSKAGAESTSEQSSATGGNLTRVIRLQSAAYVYDLLNANRDLGRVEKCTVELEPAVGRVLAISAAPAATPKLTLKKQILKHGEILPIQITGVSTPLQLTVSDKAGKIINQQRLLGKEGKFVPALNLPPGVYLLTATNLIGGNRAQAEFTLK